MKDETNKWREAALALSKSNGESCARAEAAEKRVFELEQAMNDLLDVVNQWRKKKAKELE